MSQAQRLSDANALTQTVFGDFTLLGTITATTTKNNHTTAVPFNDTGNALSAKTVTVQCDTACYIRTGAADTLTVTATNGFYLPAHGAATFTLRPENGFVACLPASGTTVLTIWEMT